MNIFYLDHDPRIAAEMMCDKHVCKMIVESAQILSTAHRVLDGDDGQHPDLYKKTHVNHPAARWTRESIDHYRWLYEHFMGLCRQYELRYKKYHKTYMKLGLILMKPPENISSAGWTPPPQCMPDNCKSEDPVEAYRQFYITEKSKFAVWQNGVNPPAWYK